MKKTIIILATLDTKGEEAGFLKDQIQKLGNDTIVIDSGVIGKPGIKADFTNIQVAERGGIPLKKLLINPTREKAAPVMAAGALSIVKELITSGKAQGIISIGGTQGTSLSTSVMRKLPYGLPKIMVSTMASSDVSVFIDIKDIIMMPSVSDILGLNPVLRRILTSAAAGVVVWLLGWGEMDISFRAAKESLQGLSETPNMNISLLIGLQIAATFTLAPLINTLFALGEDAWAVIADPTGLFDLLLDAFFLATTPPCNSPTVLFGRLRARLEPCRVRVP